ncbi:MAG: 3-isopropylmalate dehydratase small subunit [Candidatus Hydrogenedentota bacterium]
MILRGRVHKFRDDVNTDEILPARYLNTLSEKELALHCMEDIDQEFTKKVKPGDIILAGKNFGCGSSREHAPLAIKASRVSCVIAKSFARIFYRNSFNIGLPIFESEEAADEVNSDDIIEVDTEKGIILNITTGKIYKVPSIPKFMQDLIEYGGLIEYTKKMTAIWR